MNSENNNNSDLATVAATAAAATATLSIDIVPNDNNANAGNESQTINKELLQADFIDCGEIWALLQLNKSISCDTVNQKLIDFETNIHEILNVLHEKLNNDKFNSLMNNINIFFNMNNKLVKFNENISKLEIFVEHNYPMDLNWLSTSEKSLIYLLVKIAYISATCDNDKEHLILIDNIECGLHVKWQSKLVKILTMCVGKELIKHVS